VRVPNQSLAITNTEKSKVTVPYDKLYYFHKNIYWWNNDGDVVRLIDPSGIMAMETIVEVDILLGTYDE